jgi:hypothetical protein|tara:strand:- start:2 stop:268 length:267 start_codon:yes stop_codon:yes gene_type:complete
MTYCYTTQNKPLRQTARQKESSSIAENKFLKRNPLLCTNERVVLKTSPFSQNIMLNRYLMKSANFNTLNTIPEYANTMSEVINNQKAA